MWGGKGGRKREEKEENVGGKKGRKEKGTDKHTKI